MPLSIPVEFTHGGVYTCYFYLYFSPIALLPSHLVVGLLSLPALLSSFPVFLSYRFLLDNAGFRHLCFRFCHLLRCSCPIPGVPPPLPPSFRFRCFIRYSCPIPGTSPLPLSSSFLVPFPTCHLYLLFLDLLFLLSSPRVFSPLLLFLLVWPFFCFCFLRRLVPLFLFSLRLLPLVLRFLL